MSTYALQNSKRKQFINNEDQTKETYYFPSSFILNFIFDDYIVGQDGKGQGSEENGQDIVYTVSLFFFLYLGEERLPRAKPCPASQPPEYPGVGISHQCHPRVPSLEHFLRVLLLWVQ